MFREWLNDIEKLMMLQILAGEFLMGSPEDESDRPLLSIQQQERSPFNLGETENYSCRVMNNLPCTTRTCMTSVTSIENRFAQNSVKLILFL